MLGKTIFVLFLFFAFAQGQDCVVPHDDMVLNESVTFCPGTYHVTDIFDYYGGLDGVIIINKSNIDLNCNGATLIGNGSRDSYEGGWGIVVSARRETPIKNITIRNCNLEGYNLGIWVKQDYDVGGTDHWNYCTTLSCLKKYRGIISDLEIKNNRITNGLDGMIFSCASKVKIKNNEIRDLAQGAISARNSHEIIILDNHISDTDGGIGLSFSSDYVVVMGNVLETGIPITGWPSNIYIVLNSIKSSTFAITLSDAKCQSVEENVKITNNQISADLIGVVLHGVNGTIESNYFYDTGTDVRIAEKPVAGCMPN